MYPRGLQLVDHVCHVICAVDITFVAIEMIRVFLLVPDHLFFSVEMLMAVVVGTFAAVVASQDHWSDWDRLKDDGG